MSPKRMRSRIAILLAAAVACVAVPVTAAAADGEPQATAPDYSGYQALLDEYLSVTSAQGEPLETRFDYETFYDDAARHQRVARIQRAMTAVPPSKMNRATRLAWAINLYNFLVLENATEYLLVPNRGRLRVKSVREIYRQDGNFFERPVIQIEDSTYSLNTFERAFVFDGYDAKPGTTPPRTLDPRAHFALVCGAVGCPPLQPLAFQPKTLDRQLTKATRDALASPRQLVWKEDKGTLALGMLFSWYLRDFGGQKREIEFAERYAPPAIAASMRKHRVSRITYYIPWDWDLNQKPHAVLH